VSYNSQGSWKIYNTYSTSGGLHNVMLVTLNKLEQTIICVPDINCQNVHFNSVIVGSVQLCSVYTKYTYTTYAMWCTC